MWQAQKDYAIVFKWGEIVEGEIGKEETGGKGGNPYIYNMYHGK